MLKTKINTSNKNKSIKLSREAKKDLIENYSKELKEYYSEKYNIPLDKISQKVATLRFQNKKKELKK